MSASARSVCPACGKSFRVPPVPAGYAVRCPACRHKFKVAAPVPSQDTLARADEGTRSAPPAPPAAGEPQRVGRFAIRQRLGSGAFGTVYRAYDLHLRREVALKVPHPGLLNDARALERFQREGRAAAQLQHPNIVPVFDAGQDGPYHYIASAFIPGQTLRRRLDAGRPEFRAAAELVRALAEGMAHAHKMGIVHRDVKPANVMIDEQGQPCLMDFGLATELEGSERLTRAGAILGTPAYMAPEQALGRHGDPLPASDQYSLGVVLYELLTGALPFVGPVDAVLYNVIHGELVPPRSVDLSVPLDLETICLKAMAREPSRRYPDCQALADDLRRWLEGQPIAARRLGMRERAARWCRQRPRQAAAALVIVGCLALVVLVAGGIAVRQAQSRVRIAAQRARAAELATEAEDSAALAARKAQEKQRSLQGLQQASTHVEQRIREAEQALERAAAEAQKARQSRLRALLADLQGRRQLYHTHLSLARASLDQGRTEGAERWLDRQRPLVGQDDLRGLEWEELFWRGKGDTAVIRYDAGRCRALAVSPQGDRVVCLGEGRLTMWDLTGERLLWEAASRDVVGLAVFNSTGSHIAAADEAGKINVWDAHNGRGVGQVVADRGAPAVMALSPNRQTLAVAGKEGGVKLWEVQTGKERCRLAGFEGKALFLTYSPDGRRIAAACDDRALRTWEVGRGTALVTEKGPHVQNAVTLAFTPDGRSLFCGSHSGSVSVCDPASGRNLGDGTRHNASVVGICFINDGKEALSVATSGEVLVWPGGPPRLRVRFPPDTSAVGATETGTVWGLRKDGTVQVATGLGWRHAWQANPDTRPLPHMGVSPDGKHLVTVGSDHHLGLRVWDAVTGKPLHTLKGHTQAPLALVCSPDGRLLASAGKDLGIRVWELSTGWEVNSFRGQFGATAALAFNYNGRRLASSHDRAIKVWDLVRSQEAASLPGHSEPIQALTFSPDGKLLVSADALGGVKLWGLERGQELGSIKGPQSPVHSLAFSPDGRRLARASADRTVKVCEVPSGREVFSVQGDPLVPHTLRFSPDGKRLLGLSEKMGLQLWDATSGQALPSPLGPHCGGGVVAVALSGDGQLLAWIHPDGTLEVWRHQPTGTASVRTLRTATSTDCVCLYGDASRVASGGEDGIVRLWDAEKAEVRHQMSGHQGRVTCLSVHGESKRLASGGIDRSVRVWDLIVGQKLFTLEGHTDTVSCLAYSPNGRRLASGAVDGGLRLWDTEKGRELRKLAGHAGTVSSVAFSPDGERLVSAGWDDTVKVWDVAREQPLRTLRGHTHVVLSACFSPDGKQVASGGQDGSVRLWDAEQGRSLWVGEGHGREVYAVCFSEDGRLLASLSEDRTLRVWEVGSGRLLRVLACPVAAATGHSFSSDGNRLALVNGGPGVHLWSPRIFPAPVLALTGHEADLYAACFSPDGKTLVSSSFDNTARLWDLAEGKTVAILRPHSSAVAGIAFSPDGKRIVSGSYDTTVVITDAETGKTIQPLAGHTSTVYSVCYSPDGKRIASGGLDRTARVWDAATGLSQGSVSFPGERVSDVCFSPDGKLLATSGSHQEAILWDAATLKEVRRFSHPRLMVLRVAFSPDGTRLAGACADSSGTKFPGEVKVWETATSKELLTLKGHRAFVGTVCFSPDGTRIASGSHDRTVKLWDAVTGAELHTLSGDMEAVGWVCFSPDGQRLATVGAEKTVRVWRLPALADD